MEKVSSTQYAELISSCTVLEKDGYGEKVLLSDSGQIIKIFRRKRLLSGALFFPYAQRFIANAQRLRRLNIATVDVLRCGHCNNPARDLVWYQPLAGVTLRDYCRSHDPVNLAETLAQFVATLHHKGILFRSLHWGNIIVSADQTLGLIDIADLRFYRRALTLTQRQRNFRHMLRYAIDREFFTQIAAQFWTSYVAAAHLPAAASQQLQQSVAEHQSTK